MASTHGVEDDDPMCRSDAYTEGNSVAAKMRLGQRDRKLSATPHDDDASAYELSSDREYVQLLSNRSVGGGEITE